MATKVINGTVRGPDGLVKAGAIVVVSLSQPVTLNGTDEVVTSKVRTVTDVNGNYSVNLYSNSDLSPAGTYYSVNESDLAGAYSNAFAVVVPAGAGPFIMAAIMVAAPAPSPPAALDSAVVHLAGTETITGVKTFTAGLAGGNGILNVKDPAYGAKGNGQFVTDGVINSGQAILTSASGKFVAGDQGKLILVQYAGAASITLVTTILSYQSATQVTLAANAGTSQSGAFVLWCSDDTAAFTNFLNDCMAKGIKGIIPGGHYGINGALPNITTNIALEGNGCLEVMGAIAGGINTVVFPTTPPYLTGSVLWQFAAATDVLHLTGRGMTANLDDFGIAFAGIYTNTGHGINVDPPAVSTYKDSGILQSSWRRIKVFGHDGNHYAYRVVNMMYCTFQHLRSYGGGGYWARGDSQITQYGNAVFDHCFFVLLLNGTAHGLLLDAVQGNALQLFLFNRQQCWEYQPSPAIPGTSLPGAGQNTYKNLGGVGLLHFNHCDFESNVGGGYSFPNVSGQTHINGLDFGNALYLQASHLTDVTLKVEGIASQSGDLVNVEPSFAGTTVFGVDINGNVIQGLPNPGTGATDGFPYVPASAGTPTGVPRAKAGRAPMYYDTTAHKLWIYDGGWKGVVVA